MKRFIDQLRDEAQAATFAENGMAPVFDAWADRLEDLVDTLVFLKEILRMNPMNTDLAIRMLDTMIGSDDESKS